MKPTASLGALRRPAALSAPRINRRACVKVMAAKIAVIGGSGACGSETIFQALAAGDEVVALVRNPAKLLTPPGSAGAAAGAPFSNPKLTVITGSATNQADVDRVITAGTDGVVVALGGKTKEVGPTMLTDATTCVISAMKRNSVKKVAVVTSIGCGDSKDQAPFVFKMLMFTVMRSIFNDKNNQEGLFTSPTGPGKDLDYCLVRPGGLTLEPPTGIINVIDGQAGSITRADVAEFCLDAIKTANFPYNKKTPCISSVGGTSWKKDRGDKNMMQA
ncbi:hypothetical protein FOA52_013115 [Chlamydomonas sp. UWO 241]|nr:hypothetical protein FOA52_013115 [Chlamydomonas sp. UWO 241]